jgi:hypothetical protein
MKKTARANFWWWIAAAFALQLAAWAAWFTLAARHPVAEVPLATPTQRP